MSRSIGWVVDELDVLRKHGRLRPDHLSLEGTRRVLFVDPSDRRGKALLRHGGFYAAHVKDFWRWAADAFAPSLVLDVGVNYGEFFFSATYSSARRVVGVEANKNLEPWIIRSLETHPNASVFEIHYVIATDKTAGDGVLYVDTRWSGTSSVSSGGEQRREVPLAVPTMAMDDLLFADARSNDRLLFKIDVEGHEPSVLEGMKQTLGRCGAALGVVEFRSERASAADSALANDFYVSLCREFKVYYWRPLGRPRRGLTGVSAVQGVMALEGADELEVPSATDLLIAMGPDAVAAAEAYLLNLETRR